MSCLSAVKAFVCRRSRPQSNEQPVLVASAPLMDIVIEGRPDASARTAFAGLCMQASQAFRCAPKPVSNQTDDEVVPEVLGCALPEFDPVTGVRYTDVEYFGTYFGQVEQQYRGETHHHFAHHLARTAFAGLVIGVMYTDAEYFGTYFGQAEQQYRGETHHRFAHHLDAF